MSMDLVQKPGRLKSPILIPIAVYLLSFILPALVMVIPAAIFHWNTSFTFSHSYLFGTLGQLLMDLPAVILFSRLQSKGESETDARNKTRDRIVSASLGFGCALLLAILRISLTGKLMGGRFMGEVPAFIQSLGLIRPWNLLAAGMALLAYGPGEALFVVYLILAFDKAIGNPRPVFSSGVIITAVLWALPHVFNVVFYGIRALSNVVVMLFIGMVMGVLLKKTRSALGPVVFWTLVNGTSA